MEASSEISQGIIQYFEKKPEALTVFLYGSWARERQTIQSDVDVAVFFAREAIPNWEAQLRIKADLENLLNKTVDLIVLNKASPILKHQVFRYGKRLLQRDTKSFNRFWVQSLNEYDDLKRIRAPIERALASGDSQHG